MKNLDPKNKLNKSTPSLSEENYPEWRLCISIYLRQKKLLSYCNKPITSALDSAKPTKAESNEACALITSPLDSQTFSELVNEVTSQNSHKLWKGINKWFASSSFSSKARVWIRLEVGDIILAFTILTKLPEEFQPLIEKSTLNAKQQGNPDNVLKTLHEQALKGEELSSDSSKAVARNRKKFPSKTVHYCANGKHNPLVKSHATKKCWKLHPELRCNSSSLKAEAIGTAKIIDRKGKTWNLHNSLYVPALTTNLLCLTHLRSSETRIKK
ncbi:hypothetical protein O181_089327 [Austropuccinia psidii MF-1]|uniref:Uncharacterized protein n=1 Tax=Austropuccinia psidii MF-1 TaxID=1389203 RepID=A0A9Q3IT85_9BASI|nr:hypothetical protein [Austropuccinia psidii MF-1]